MTSKEKLNKNNKKAVKVKKVTAEEEILFRIL